MSFQYFGEKYTDEDMAVLKRFEHGNIIDYSKDGYSFYKLRNNYLIRQREGFCTDNMMPTTIATGRGVDALRRYEHPIISRACDIKDLIVSEPALAGTAFCVVCSAVLTALYLSH